jgi:uncharacterized protein
MTICPKCQYLRVATDTAPDWQCPKCGVAYNKVANSIKQAVVPDDEEIDLDEGAGISAKTVVIVLLFVLLAGFGFLQYRHAHSVAPANSPVDSVAPVSAQFDAAKQAYDASNFPKATKEFTILAEAGDSKAQYYLGRIYTLDWSGTGLDGSSARQPSDREKSVYWFKKAAEQGDLLAQIELGNIYIHNLGGGTNPAEEAFKWVQMAADQGDPGSQFLIGTFYEQGKGVAKDIAQAITWYRAAANQGHGGGLYGLGMLYAKGVGVTTNSLTAYKFLLLAAAQNDRDPSVAGAFWARERSKEIAAQLNKTELTEADNFVASWKPGQLLPG